jgi:hypothetical protein
VIHSTELRVAKVRLHRGMVMRQNNALNSSTDLFLMAIQSDIFAITSRFHPMRPPVPKRSVTGNISALVLQTKIGVNGKDQGVEPTVLD